MRGTSARAEHIDIAKGISIVLVAMFHSPLEYYFNAVVEPMALFRLPLFFVLSGVFFSWRADAGTFLRKKADALLKPYAVVLGGLLLWHWVGGGDEIGRRFWGILYGNGDTIAWVPMWFLTHLFSVYAVAFFVCRITPLRVGWAPGVGLLLCLIVVAAFGIGALYGAEITVFGRVTVVPGLPFSLDLVVITGSLFLIGRVLKDPIVNFTPNALACVLCGALFWVVSQYTDAHIDLNQRVFSEPLYATAAAVCGVYLVLSIATLLARVSVARSVLVRLGQASLFILMFHLPLIELGESLLFRVVTDRAYAGGVYIVAFLFGVLCPVLLKTLVEHSRWLSLALLPAGAHKTAVERGAMQKPL